MLPVLLGLVLCAEYNALSPGALEAIRQEGARTGNNAKRADECRLKKSEQTQNRTYHRCLILRLFLLWTLVRGSAFQKKPLPCGYSRIKKKLQERSRYCRIGILRKSMPVRYTLSFQKSSKRSFPRGMPAAAVKIFPKKTVLSDMGTVALFWESEISCDAF